MSPDKQTVLVNHKSHHGMTLIELMIAMVISLIVLLAVGTVYFSTKRTYSVQDKFSQMQENALYAFQTLTADISSAGYAGCSLNLSNDMNVKGGTVDPAMYDFTTGVYGWEYKGTSPGSTAYTITSLSPTGTAADWTNYTSSTLDPAIAKYAIPGNDVLVVISSRQQNLVLSSPITHGASSISFANKTGVPGNKIMIVSNCKNADVFMNTTDNSTALDLGTSCGGQLPCNSATITHDYNNLQDTKFYASTSRAYFVGRAVDGEPALFRYDLDEGQPATPQELVEGVENMQVLYGEDVGGDFISANHYVPINQVSNAHNIYAVRISLLMRSGTIDRPKPAVAPVEYLGATGETVPIQPPVDQRIRKVFTTTIALRNMQVFGH